MVFLYFLEVVKIKEIEKHHQQLDFKLRPQANHCQSFEVHTSKYSIYRVPPPTAHPLPQARSMQPYGATWSTRDDASY